MGDVEAGNSVLPHSQILTLLCSAVSLCECVSLLLPNSLEEENL